MLLKYTYTTILFCFISFFSSSQEYNFWKYTAQNGLISSKTTCILQDYDGFLWVGTQSGVSKFDGKTFLNYDRFDNLSNNYVSHLFQDSSKTIWIGHNNGDVSSFSNSKFKTIISNSDSIISFSKSIYNTLIITTKKTIYKVVNNHKLELPFYTQNKNETFVSCYQIKKNHWFVITNKRILEYSLLNNFPTLKDALSLNISPSFSVELQDNYYALVSKKGDILVIDKTLNVVDRNKINYTVNSISCKKNSISAATNTGVVEINFRKNVIHIKKNISTKNGLISNKIVAVIKDNSNTTWIGTKENGLLALPNINFPVFKQKKELGELISYNYKNNTKNIIVTHENAVLLVTSLEEETASKTIYFSKKKTLTCALLGNTGEIWFGTEKGLFLKFPNSTIEYGFKELANQKINDIKWLNNGNLLIATNKSVYTYSQSLNKISPYFPKGDINNFIVKKFIYVDDVLYGVGNGNIIKIENKEVVFLFKPEDENIKDLEFSSVFKSDNETLWVGTQGKGIFTYENSNTYELLTKTINLPYKYINSFYIEDSLIWLTTKQGIAKVNLNTGNSFLYGSKYLNHVTFNFLSPIKFNNKIFFFAKEGLVRLTPSLFSKSTSQKVKINSFKVSGREVPLQSALVFNYGNYPIKINYESINLKEKVYFQYKLKGYHDSWSEATTQNNVLYSNLPPGEYSFKVRLINPKNNTIASTQTISFKIKIPFWRTTKFYIILFLGVVLLFTLIYFTRVYRLRKQKKKLEIEVERKTFQISRQNKHLEQFSYSLSHDLKNPINNIKGLVEILEEDKSDEIIKMLSDCTSVLENKILTTLKSIQKAQANTKNITTVSFSLVFERVKKSLLILIKESNAQIKTNFNVKTLQYEEPIIESILYNLISNAIKYKHPDRTPYIEVYTKKTKGFIHITVGDNGLGIDLKKEKERIFSIFKRVHKDAEGTGLGLYMIKQMIELNEGNIEVESETNIGTTFHVYLKELKDKK